MLYIYIYIYIYLKYHKSISYKLYPLGVFRILGICVAHYKEEGSGYWNKQYNPNIVPLRRESSNLAKLENWRNKGNYIQPLKTNNKYVTGKTLFLQN